MADNSGDSYPDEPGESLAWTRIVYFAGQLRRYYLLYFVTLGAFLVLFGAMYVVIPPTYAAVAVLGPPNPSPTNSLRASVNGGTSVSGSITSRLLGNAGASGGNDPFQEYQQLLHSSRLAEELEQKDKLLPVIFHKQWDAENKRWRKPSFLKQLISDIERFFNRPVGGQPDVNSLQTFLDNSLDISPVTSGRVGLLTTQTLYVATTLTYEQPREAARLLAVILRRADDIIRQEQLQDVLARISYVRSELPKVTETDYRQTMIDTLSGQEQLRIMMVADQRYAFTEVDTPHTLTVPVSPMRPISALLISIVLSLSVWIGVVYFSDQVGFLRRTIRRFAR